MLNEQTYRQLQSQNGTSTANLCYPNECEPFGKCELVTQRCIVEGTERNESNVNIPICDKYVCRCQFGYSGPECSLPTPTICNGPYEERIIQQYHLNIKEHQQQSQFLVQVDPEQAICYNGGICQSLIDPLTNRNAFRCNCDGAKNGQPVNPLDTKFERGSGYNCQHTKYVSCVEDDQISNIHYCINGGQCLRLLPNDNDTIDSLPCTCPVNKYEGRHCQYLYNQAPVLELQYVRTKLLQEEQRIQQNNGNKNTGGQQQNQQQQQESGIGSGGYYTSFFIILLFVTGGIFFIYKRQKNNNQRRDISHITTGMELDVSTSETNNKNRTTDSDKNVGSMDVFDISNDDDDDDDMNNGTSTKSNNNNNNNTNNKTKVDDDEDDIELKEII